MSALAVPVAAAATTLQSDADAYIRWGGVVGDTNYGTSTSLYIRESGDPLGSSSGSLYRSLIHFDLSSIPAGATIESATLYGYQSARTGDREVAAYRVTGAWNESGVTWNSQPSVAAQPTGVTDPGSAAAVWIGWDVTSDVQAYVQGTSNYGWMLAFTNESVTSDEQRTQLRSREYTTDTTQCPYLNVTYSASGAAAPVANFTANVTTGTAPLAVQFTDTSTDATSWAWDVDNDGTIDSTEQNPAYTYASTGTYTVNLTVANVAGSDSEIKTDYVTVTGAGTGGLAETAWPKFGYDLSNTGQSPYAGPHGGKVAWKYEAAGAFQYNGAVLGSDGTIYIGNYGAGTLYALNADGTLKWSYATGGSVCGSPAIGSDGTVYVGSRDKNLYAINADGSLKWSYATGGYIYGSPAIGSDGTVYVGNYDNSLYAINADGSLKWTYATGGRILYGCPAIGSDGTVYVGSYDKSVYALNPNGTLKWSYATGGYIYGSPAIAPDGTVYVGSRDKNLYALNPNGTLKWSYATGGYIYGSPAIASDGTVYAGSYDNSLYAFNADGSLKWSYATGGSLRYDSPVIGSDGLVYIWSYDKFLYAINPDGTLAWTYATGNYASFNTPAIGSDGTLYFGGYENKLYAFKDVAPVAGFSGTPTGGNTPVTVQFTDESENTPTSWLWNFGDGNTSTVQNPGHTYTEAGTYTVTLTVTNSQGSDSTTKTDYITVSPEGATAAVFSGTPTSGFVPMTVQFTDASTNAPTSWAWDFDDDGTIDSTDQNPSYTYNTPGTYTVKLTASGPAGSSDKIETDYITVEPANSVADTAWPKFHYDIKNTGQSPYNGSQTNNVAWSYTADGSLDFNSAVIGTDGTIYIGCSGTNKFYALNPDGTLKWTFSDGSSSAKFEDSPALGMDGTIYTGNRNGNLYALNPDGTLKWSYATGNDIYHAPTIGPDGTVYVASFDRYLYAIDQEGALKWRVQWQAASNTNFAFGSPAIESDGTIYVGSTDGVLYAFNLDGTEKWNYTTGKSIYGSPAIGSDGTVYVGDDGGILSALNADGTLKWNCSVGYYFSTTFVNEPVRSTPAIGSDGTVYVGAMNGHLYAINASGTIQWSYATSSYVYGSPTIGADGTVYVVNNAGKVCAINPDGTLEWESSLGGSIDSNSPAIGSDSTLYVTAGSTLYAIRPEAPVADFSADPTSGDEPLTVRFTDESAKAPTSWLWDFGDGDSTNATMQNPVHTYNTAGTYTVTLTAANVAGNGTASKTGCIAVLEAVIPVANFSAEPTSGDVPLTVRFTDESANNPTSWLWDFGDGDDTNATVQNPVHTYNASGTYTVTLTAANVAGNGTVSKTGCIAVVDAVTPVVNFSSDLTSGVVPLTVQFTDESTNTPTSWLWDFGDGLTSDQQNPSHRYIFAGTYTVTLTATNAGGSGVGTKTEYITVTAGETVELAATAWPKFGYDLNNTGQSPYAGPQSNNTLWTYTAGGKFYSGGSSIGPYGTIYIGNADKNLYAFYPNGTLKWSYGADGPFGYSTPAIDSNGTVYIGSEDGKLYAINPDGTLKWSYATGGYVYSSPTIGPDGRIYVGSYVGSGDGSLHALYPDGTVMWTYTGGSYFYIGSPAIGPDGTIYAGNYDQKLYAVHPNGTLKWSYETGGGIRNAPAIATDGTVYVGSFDQNLYAINPDGTLRWNYTTGAKIYGAPAIAADGTVYIGSNDQNLYAVNPDGTLKWTYGADSGFRYSQPVIGADGTVYIGDNSGKCYGISPEGTLKWEYATGGRIYGPVSIGSDGTLYLGSYDQNLYAFRDAAEFSAGPKGGGAPLTVRFTDESTGAPTSWLWDFGDGDDTNTTVQNPVHTYTAPGVYNVTLTVADAYHSYSTEKIGYINVTSGGSGEAPPVPSFTTNASSGRVPFTVQFTDTTTGNVSSWSWNFGDGGTSDEQNPVHTYVTEGTHTVTLTATGPGGYDTATVTLTADAPLTTGSGGSPLLTVQEGNVSGGLWHDSWPGFDGYGAKNFTLPDHTAIKWARIYVDVYCGLMTDNKSVALTLDIDADGDGTYELQKHEADSVVYSGTPAWANDHMNRVTSDYFIWYDLTDAINGSEVNIRATGGGSDGRIKHVTLVVAYDDGDEDVIHYWVNQGHDISNYGGYTGSTEFDTSAFSNPGAVNLTSLYCASEDGAYTFNGASLSSGGPAVSGGYFGYNDWNATGYFNSGENSTLAYTCAGTYYKIQVALLTVSGAGSSGGDSAPAANFSADPTSGTAPLTVQFTDESTNTPTSWSWDFGDNTTATEQNATHTYTAAGNYTVTLTVTNTAGSDTETKTDYIAVTSSGSGGSAPVANFMANATSGEAPLAVQFADMSANVPTAWSWDFGDNATSAAQHPQHTYTSAGTYTVTLTAMNAAGSDTATKTDYIAVSTPPVLPDLTIAGTVNPVPASAVFAREANPVTIRNIKNTGDGGASGIKIALYASDVANGTVEVNTTTIDSLASGATATVTITDPTIRDLQGDTITYTATLDPDNLIAETDESNNNKTSAVKSVKYNGYKGKGIYWDGGSNVTTKQTYDLRGDIVYATQPESAYKAVGWTDRTETWTAADLPIPANATVEKAFLFFSYNWDQTATGVPNLTATFNGNVVALGTPYMDESNFGAYPDYEYGLYPAVDVTSLFVKNGDNTLVTTPNDGNVNALYPSTLAVIYSDPTATRKLIFINEECDELGVSANSYGTTMEEATAYVPFSGMEIDTADVLDATMHGFIGSAGPDEGNLFFNGQNVANGAWQGSICTASAQTFNVTSLLNATGNEAAIQGTTSGGMVVLQQFLVVEYADPVLPDLTVSTLASNNGEVFSLSENTYTAKITNIGEAEAGAFAVGFNVSGVTGTVAVDGLAVGANTTVTWTDETVRDAGAAVEITATADVDGAITESNEDNNVKTLEKTVVDNGYRGKRWTGGSDIETVATYDVRGDLVTSSGDSAYLSATTYPHWTTYAVNWTASDLAVPDNATIAAARLYVPYTWDKGPVFPDNVTLAFNDVTVEKTAHYDDEKMWGTSYPYGTTVYDVTGQFGADGNVALLTSTYPGGGNVSVRGMLLAVVYDDGTTAPHTVLINEGFDLLYGGSSQGTTPEQATAYAPFAAVESGATGARLVTVAPGAGPTEGELIFNDETWTNVWNYTGTSQIGVDERNVTSYLAGENTAAFQSSGDYMEAAAAFLVVEYPVPTGSIAVTSTPAGAAVWLDGTDTGLVSPTALDDVPVGDHVITLKLDDYADASTPVVVAEDETAVIHLDLTTLTGSLAVTSTPAGAAVFIDGADTGEVTNATLADLGVGEHTVTLKMTGSRDAAANVTIRSDETASLHLDMVEAVGSIAVASSPAGASIWLDGAATGETTNATLENVPVGEHTVTVTKDGYMDATATVTVVDNETATVTFVLTEPTGSILVTSTPDGAAIFLDGVDTGEVTNTTLEHIPVGEHEIALKLDGYADAAATVTVAEGETVSLHLDLECAAITLHPGWNFISTPKRLAAGQDTIAIFDEVDTAGHSVLYYDSEVGLWDAMSSQESFKPLDGIWIYANDTYTFPLSFAAGSVQTPPEKALYEGWNAIGFTDTVPATAADTLLSVDDAWTILMGFDADEQAYGVSIINGATGRHGEERAMTPTKGYWLQMTGPGTLYAIGA